MTRMLHDIERDSQFFNVGVHNSQFFKVKGDLPDFYGSSQMMVVWNWVDEMDSYFEKMNPPEHIQYEIAAYKLKGDACVWWNSVQSDRIAEGQEQFSSWPEMKKLLICRYPHTTRLTKFRNQLNKEKGEEAPKYANCSTLCPIQSINVKQEENNVGGSSKGDESSKGRANSFMPSRCLTEVPCESYIYEQEATSDFGPFDESEIISESTDFETLGKASHMPTIDGLIEHPVNEVLEEENESYCVKKSDMQRAFDCEDEKLKLLYKVALSKSKQLPIGAMVQPQLLKAVLESTTQKVDCVVGSVAALDMVILGVTTANFLDYSNENISTRLTYGEYTYMAPTYSITRLASILFVPGGIFFLTRTWRISLRDLRNRFLEKYGSFVERCANKVFAHKFQLLPPSKDMKLQLMHDTAAESCMKWNREGLEQTLFKHPTNGQELCREERALIMAKDVYILQSNAADASGVKTAIAEPSKNTSLYNLELVTVRPTSKLVFKHVWPCLRVVKPMSRLVFTSVDAYLTPFIKAFIRGILLKFNQGPSILSCLTELKLSHGLSRLVYDLIKVGEMNKAKFLSYGMMMNKLQIDDETYIFVNNALHVVHDEVFGALIAAVAIYETYMKFSKAYPHIKEKLSVHLIPKATTKSSMERSYPRSFRGVFIHPYLLNQCLDHENLLGLTKTMGLEGLTQSTTSWAYFCDAAFLVNEHEMLAHVVILLHIITIPGLKMGLGKGLLVLNVKVAKRSVLSLYLWFEVPVESVARIRRHSVWGERNPLNETTLAYNLAFSSTASKRHVMESLILVKATTILLITPFNILGEGGIIYLGEEDKELYIIILHKHLCYKFNITHVEVQSEEHIVDTPNKVSLICCMSRVLHLGPETLEQTSSNGPKTNRAFIGGFIQIERSFPCNSGSTCTTSWSLENGFWHELSKLDKHLKTVGLVTLFNGLFVPWCNLQTDTELNLTRGRVIPWEGWKEVDNTNTEGFKKTLKLFFKLVNGLDPPCDVMMSMKELKVGSYGLARGRALFG